jgi:hypothetical protein
VRLDKSLDPGSLGRPLQQILLVSGGTGVSTAAPSKSVE